MQKSDIPCGFGNVEGIHRVEEHVLGRGELTEIEPERFGTHPVRPVEESAYHILVAIFPGNGVGDLEKDCLQVVAHVKA